MTIAKQPQQQQQPRRIKQQATIYKRLAIKDKSELPHNQFLIGLLKSVKAHK